MRFEQEAFYIKTRDEMMQLFGELEHALDRTYDIAQRCQLKLEKVAEPFPALPHSARSHHRQFLRIRVARQGFEKRAADAWKPWPRKAT